MKTVLRLRNLLLFFCLAGTLACDKNGNINILSVQDDKNLGLKVSGEIASNPAQFPLLPEAGNENSYQYIRGLLDKILSSGKLAYRNEFAWEVKIIRDDNTLNAFCTPGGYIYVYTGLIKYLNTEDELLGVLGHEVAHADLRHTSRQMTRSYSYETLIQVITGKQPGTLAQIAIGLKGLANSREFETEADNRSVDYLSGTAYACNGAAGFFEKLNSDNNSARPPEWLSTHPNPENRISGINKKAEQLGCNRTPLNPPSYQNFKNGLL